MNQKCFKCQISHIKFEIMRFLFKHNRQKKIVVMTLFV